MKASHLCIVAKTQRDYHQKITARTNLKSPEHPHESARRTRSNNSRTEPKTNLAIHQAEKIVLTQIVQTRLGAGDKNRDSLSIKAGWRRGFGQAIRRRLDKPTKAGKLRKGIHFSSKCTPAVTEET